MLQPVEPVTSNSYDRISKVFEPGSVQSHVQTALAQLGRLELVSATTRRVTQRSTTKARNGTQPAQTMATNVHKRRRARRTRSRTVTRYTR